MNRFILFLYLLFPLFAFAASDTPIENVLSKLLEYMTGAPARVLAILAIVSVGYATLFLGKLPKDKAVSVVMGIAIIFGSAAFVRTLGI